MTTALDRYMTANGLKDADFATLIGRDRSMVHRLRHGRVRPSLDVAARIEEVTSGEVPMNSWVQPTANEAEAA